MSIAEAFSFVKSNLIPPEIPGDLGKALEKYCKTVPTKTDQSPDRLFASGLYYTCPRQFILNYWQPGPREPIGFKSICMMSAGTMYHQFLQEMLLGPMLCLRGTWIRNLAEKEGGRQYSEESVEGYHPDPLATINASNNRKATPWLFQEKRIENLHNRISGRYDGVVSVDRLAALSGAVTSGDKYNWMSLLKDVESCPAGVEQLLEIKTTGSQNFDRLDELPDWYKMQANIYMAEEGKNETQFLFVDRDSIRLKAMMCAREEVWVNEYKRKCRVIWEAVRDETLPESMMKCKAITDGRAKSCEFSSCCFKFFGEEKRRCKYKKFEEFVEEGKRVGVRLGRTFLNLKGVVYV